MDCIEMHSALCFLLCVHKHSKRSINNCLGLWFTVNLITDKTWIKPLRSSLLSRVVVMKFEVWQKRQHRAWTQRLIQKYKRWIFCLRWSEVTYWGSFRTRVKASGKNRIPVERRCHTFYHSCSSLFQRSEASRSGSTDIEEVVCCTCSIDASKRQQKPSNWVQPVQDAGNGKDGPLSASLLTLCLSSSISWFTGNISSRSRLLFWA